MLYKIYDFKATNSLDESRGFDPDIITIKNGKLIETSYGSRNSKSSPAQYLPMGLLLNGHREYNGDWTLDTSDLR